MANAPSSHEAAESSTSIFPMREYLDIILHRRWGFVFAFVIVGCLGALYTLHQPKIYEAVTAVIINPEPPTINALDSGNGAEQWYFRDTYYDTQLKVMQSRNVAQRVIDDLGLATDIDFLGLTEIKDPNILAKKMASVDAVSALLGMLRVEALNGTRLVNIRIRHKNPQMAATLANAIAKAYSEQNAEQRLTSLNNTFEFIDKQYKDNEEKLTRAREDINAFKENHKILYSNPLEQQKITNQRLDYLNNKRVEIETERQNAGYLLSELKAIPVSTDNVRAYDILIGSSSFESAMNECKTLQREEHKLLVTYLEKSPQVTSIRDQITTCRNGVLASMKNAVTGLNSKHQALIKLNQEIVSEIQTLQKEALELDQLRLLYEQVESQKQEQERLFEQSQKKLNEVSLNRLLEVNNIRILDMAIAPQKPVSPNLILNGAITLFAALIAGVLIVLLLELLDISVRTQSDIEERARLPFLGAVPQIPRGRNYSGRGAHRFVLENPRSPVVESIRTLRTTLAFQLKSGTSHVLLITSAQPLEGKTMTSINLAVATAMGGQRVVLIEADMRRPRIYEALNLKSEKGLSSVIANQMPVSEALMDTEIEQLKLLPCGSIPSNPAELFETKRFEEMLNELRSMFDVVIIDSPPVTVVTDALIISRHVHGVILVARADKTPLPMLVRARELLEGVSAPIMGCVLNGVTSRSGGYYGGYYYYKKSYSDD